MVALGPPLTSSASQLLMRISVNVVARLLVQLALTDPLVAPPAGLTAFTPDQIHITLGGGPSAGSPMSLACAFSIRACMPQQACVPSRGLPPACKLQQALLLMHLSCSKCAVACKQRAEAQAASG